MRIRVCDDNEKERNQLVGICKVKRRYKIVAILFCILILMTGCGKKFWEYPSAWVSNEPYVIINTTNHDAQIEINEKIIDVNTGWKNNGRGITVYYNNENKDVHSKEDIIWECSCELKGDKLYLTIDKDYVSDKQGETIVLEQQEEEQ